MFVIGAVVVVVRWCYYYGQEMGQDMGWVVVVVGGGKMQGTAAE